MRTELVLHFVITIACWGMWPVMKKYGNSGSAMSILIVSTFALIPLIINVAIDGQEKFTNAQ